MKKNSSMNFAWKIFKKVKKQKKIAVSVISKLGRNNVTERIIVIGYYPNIVCRINREGLNFEGSCPHFCFAQLSFQLLWPSKRLLKM
jgi:hypothetical protein